MGRRQFPLTAGALHSTAVIMRFMSRRIKPAVVELLFQRQALALRRRERPRHLLLSLSHFFAFLPAQAAQAFSGQCTKGQTNEAVRESRMFANPIGRDARLRVQKGESVGRTSRTAYPMSCERLAHGGPRRPVVPGVPSARPHSLRSAYTANEKQLAFIPFRAEDAKDAEVWVVTENPTALREPCRLDEL